MMKRLNCLVSGTLVGYERYVQRQALDLSLTGYIEKHAEQLEVVAEGQEADLERLLLWIKRGTPQSKVVVKDITWSEATGGMDKFYIYD